MGRKRRRRAMRTCEHCGVASSGEQETASIKLEGTIPAVDLRILQTYCFVLRGDTVGLHFVIAGLTYDVEHACQPAEKETRPGQPSS